MEINDLGVVQRTLKFKEDNRVKAIRAVQGETARTIVFNLVDDTGAVVDASKYTLDMVIAIKGYTDEVMAKGNSEGEFTVTLPQSMLSVYGKGLAQLTIREGEQALSTISCRIEIAQNIKYEGSGVNLMFSFNELRDKLTILEGLVDDGTKALNTTLEARDTVQTKADLVEGLYIELKEAENNEAVRQDNETKRKSNETARQANEATRQTNEDTRVASEKQRTIKEDERLVSEGLRVLNEASRVDAEEYRESSEGVRAAQEDERLANENARLDSELLRQTSETQREVNELKRKSNEDIRISAEDKRVTEEAVRVENEKKRGSKFDIWSKTLDGVEASLDATDTNKGLVKVSSSDGETAPYTVVSVGRLKEELLNSGLSEEDVKAVVDAKVATLKEELLTLGLSEEDVKAVVDTKVATLREELLTLGLSEEDVKAVVDTKVNSLKEELINLGLTEEDVKVLVDTKVASINTKLDSSISSLNTKLETAEDELQTLITGVDSKIVPEATIDTKIDSAKTELGTQISELNTKVGTQYLDTNTSLDQLESDVAKKQDKLTAGDNIDITGDIISAVDTVYNDTQIKADVAKKQDKLVAGDNIDIIGDTIGATDTITTINGKTGAITKADITALGIPSKDTVYKKPSSEPISYIQGLQAELDSKVESYGTNPVLNIAVISAGGSTTGIPNNTLILELE